MGIRKMVYLWECAEDYPQDCIAEYDSDKSPDRFIFKQGEFIHDIKLPIIFHMSASLKKIQKLDHICNQTLVPLVGSKIVSVLEKYFKNDIQLLDTIIKVNNDVIDNYKLVNIIHKVKAINHELSEYELVPGTDKIMLFDTLIYNADCLKNFDMARDAEYNGNIIVSEKVKNIFEKSKFLGCGIFNPEDTI